jgi:hypothetical protein
MSHTLDAPPVDNLAFGDDSSNLTAWSISDENGLFAFSSTDANASNELSVFYLGTDSTGNINNFEFGVDSGSPDTPGFFGEIGTDDAEFGPAIAETYRAQTGATPTLTEVSSTPEPSTIALGLLGGGIILVAMWRRPLIAVSARSALRAG